MKNRPIITIVKTLLQGVVALMVFLGRFFLNVIRLIYSGKPRADHRLKASFALEKSVLLKRNKGFCLTGSSRQISTSNSYRNALIIGGTGVGKTSTVLIPTLLQAKGNFIIHDPSGELYAKTSGALKKRGYMVSTLNFSLPEVSIGFNPLEGITNQSQIQKIASLIVSTSNAGASNPFWDSQAEGLIAVMIEISRQSKSSNHLAGVRYMIEQFSVDKSKTDSVFENFASPRLALSYQNYSSMDERLRGSVIASALSCLTIFNDKSVALATSKTTFDFASLRKNKVVLYIQNDIHDTSYYGLLVALFFEGLWRRVMNSLPTKTDKDIWFLIDEAASLYLPSLPLATANIRKYRAGIMLVVQDLEQLTYMYGPAKTKAIIANCFSHVYFAGQSIDTAMRLERMLGKYEYEQGRGIRSRSLLTADEIRSLGESQALIMAGRHRPILASLTPYYKRRKLRLLTDIPEAKQERSLPYQVNYPKL